MTLPDPEAGPTVRRILLGFHMRRLREASGLTRAEAADRIRGSESKMSRLELGRVGIKPRDVKDLLDLYELKDRKQRESFIAMADGTTKPGWWNQYNEALPDWFQNYVGLEEAADRIRTYEAQFVPGLLQSEEYARAVIAAGRKDDKVEDRLALRMERQERFAKQRDAKLWAIIDEAAAKRPVGPDPVMRRQWERLLELCESPSIVLQIIPFDVGAHAAESGSFTILRYPYAHLNNVVYIEHLTGRLLLEKPADTEVYTMAMENLSVAALQPDQTKELLRKMIKNMDG